MSPLGNVEIHRRIDEAASAARLGYGVDPLERLGRHGDIDALVRVVAHCV